MIEESTQGSLSGELTDEQRAVIDCDVPCFVEACPGAGKTRTIVALFMHQARILPPRHGIAILSFTNVAAEEVRARAGVVGVASLADYPHFVGTFDAFITRFLVAPFGHRWADPSVPTRVIETWGSLGIEVRPPGGEQGPGVPLDAFELTEDEQLVLNERMVPPPARRAVQANPSGWIAEADKTRKRLFRKGYMSCHDARMCGLRRLRDADRGPGVVRALAARFKQLIVDEAQDSNSTDLAIVEVLANAGVRTVIVADRDQSIFGFRKAKTADLDAATSGRRRLRLSGNFRSAPVICQATATLKSTPIVDDAAGEAARMQGRVVMLGFEGGLGPHVGARFFELAGSLTLAPAQCAILAYKENDALKAVGEASRLRDATSTIDRLADAVATFRRADIDGRQRRNAVLIVENVLLQRLGLTLGGGTTGDIAEEHGVSPAWLRSTAMQLLGVLATQEVADTESRKWIDFVREHLGRSKPPPGVTFVRTAAEIVRRQRGWTPPRSQPARSHALATTIHQAKGREFGGVLLVLGESSRLGQFFDAWESRADEESRRVYYVGATRARRLLALAVPKNYAERAMGLLSRNGGSVERENVAPVAASCTDGPMVVG